MNDLEFFIAWLLGVITGTLLPSFARWLDESFKAFAVDKKG